MTASYFGPVKGFFATLLVLAGAPSFAEGASVWEVLGDWTIRINSEDESRCFASRVLEDGSEVQIGTEPTLDGGYFAVYNPDWTGIEDGKTGFVEFDFGSSRYGGESVGRIEDGIPGGYAFFDNPAFVQDFARKQSVKIIGDGGAEFNMDLTGTSGAVRAVLACQDDQPAPEATD